MVPVKKSYGESNHEFSKCLAQTDTLATKERRKRERVSLSAVWSRIEGRIRTEALWNELMRLLPLRRIILHVAYGNGEYVSFKERNSPNSHILREAASRTSAYSWLNPERLEETILQVGELLTQLIVKLFSQIVADGTEFGVNLCK